MRPAPSRAGRSTRRARHSEHRQRGGLAPARGANRSSRRAGRLRRLHRGVYAVGHPRVSLQGRCLAAVLACGEESVVSHASAAFLWDLAGSLASPIDVTVRGSTGRTRRRGIRVHSSLLLASDSITARWAIPLTTVERALRDLRRAGRQERCLSAFRRAIDLRLVEAPATPAEELTRSELERRFLALCRRHRPRPPEVNARVGPYEVGFLRQVVESGARSRRCSGVSSSKPQ